MIYLLLAVFVFLFLRIVLSWFNWGFWTRDARPDPNAKISDVSREKVKYAKNYAAFKTTVDFSDGYRYVTHKTNSKQGFLSYTISVDAALDAEIKANAICRHDKAVQRKLK